MILNHLNLAVSDVQAARAFLVKYFGLDPGGESGNDKIAFLLNTVVEDVHDVDKKEVTGLKLRNVKTSEVWDFPTSAMFLGIGHIPNAKMFEGQLDTDQDGYLKTKNYVFTRVDGVYACGDVQDRRYRQAITAAGSGCMAALEVEKFLEEQGH